MDDLLSNHPALTAVTGGVIVATAGIVVYRWMRASTSNTEADSPPDVVVLHQVGRGPYAPSMVPFAVKLETYLRMAKIPYVNHHGIKMSSKGKFPWISYNGQSIADSAFCIEFLNKYRDVDLNSWLTPEEKAVALAFQRLVEDDLYWVLVVQRLIQAVDMDFIKMAWNKFLPFLFPGLFFKFVLLPAVRKMTYAQGMGRHSKEEVLSIARKDFAAINNFLGSKKFLMGDQPCEQDCAVFGQLSQMCWQQPGPAGSIFKEEFPRLVAYCERMRAAFWPDWEQCTTQGGTQEAAKSTTPLDTVPQGCSLETHPVCSLRVTV